ncbi:glucose-6-phosphate dehydrogenase [Serinibacter salmoneus]|uniref:Glucose-6-phosphate 1-dehydrogenase n=1 Tax=Serinibacter salmoneus TaxID=556530 RepID=A0A2A9CYC0_9MICO|nr:glucose-6-phosphate dehydrogenase [Serinibacter salmoneus]PFG18579.1 glucose-6-phosphate 1-dehydrogenase [Serinibacter salmoneus]
MSQPSTLVILGASGDLTRRLLLPGVGSLLELEPERELRILAADRADLDAQAWQDRLQPALTEGGAPPEVVQAVAATSTYTSMDATDPVALNALLTQAAGEGGARRVVLYFALPPAVTERVCHAMLGLTLPRDLHLTMEKPFGHDEHSARALNTLVAHLVPDDQVHRVDHFLGKSTLLDIMAVRFANRLFSAVWSAEHIESIEIAYDESLALENRAGYYDHAGALRDMIQSHLLQAMALVTMEPPASITARDLRDATAAALRATTLWGGDAISGSRRARYTAGTSIGRAVPSYVDEDGVDPARMTETLAQITVEVANDRWAGVPITIRSGKALGATQKHIVITFRDVRHLPRGLKGADPKDRLIIGLSPDTMELRITTNGTDDPLELEQSVLATTLRESELEAYGEVIAGVLDGNPMLTVRGDAAEECWRICDAVLGAWERNEVPMEEYPAGSPVPAAWGAALAD